jgi:glycosyltransferase involved in cell wall biosynthesis
MFAYIHTPARYVWVPELDGRGTDPLSRFIASGLQNLDRRKASEVGQLAANSRFIAQRIEDTWGQESTVIYPPVAIEEIQAVKDWPERLNEKDFALLNSLPETFVLGASRFVRYKNLVRVIEVGESIDTPVVLAGGGPDKDRLAARAEDASVPVVFVDRPSNELLYAIYSKALAYVFPPIEDFGIMPVEAMALGTPTLVNPVGGAAESVAILDGGATMNTGAASDLRNAVDTALGKDMEQAKARAKVFSEQTFRSNIRSWMAGKDLRTQVPGIHLAGSDVDIVSSRQRGEL